MRVTPIERIYNLHQDKPKPQRAMLVQHYDMRHIRDRVIGDITPADKIDWWEVYNEVNNRGIIV